MYETDTDWAADNVERKSTTGVAAQAADQFGETFDALKEVLEEGQTLALARAGGYYGVRGLPLLAALIGLMGFCRHWWGHLAVPVGVAALARRTFAPNAPEH